MTTIEYLISKLPMTIQRYENETCYCCRKTYSKRRDYEFHIEVLQHEIRPNVIKPHYKMFYKCGNKIIGHSAGIGFLTQKKALKNLLEYKNEIRNRINKND